MMLQKANLDGVQLEYEVQGAGEPVILIHGSVVADAYLPMMPEPALAPYQVVRYRREGFGNSTHPAAMISIRDQANDCLALMRQLKIARAHVAGHSYGGVIALQLALDHPEAVHSLALLEPALVGQIPNSAEFMGGMGPVMNTYQKGDKRGALEGFLNWVAGPGYGAMFDTMPGSFDMALADADNFFAMEMPAMGQWSFTREDAQSIQPPVLALLGATSAPVFHEIQKLIQMWMPKAKAVTVPKANHMLQTVEPRAVGELLASFWATHPMR
jgi:pimeloyl-ACP methyl ester carboxylesterase